ncbi:catalase family peroxidase [Planococcus sp. ISL-109]|uniref:catalase family peroxidase n=1 Tax=Planococcus sp. ISL-109 TaxID=2819166 RepID=UPI001BE8B766|nr:catalase family peroxidase [Planococcus sp. ISL-109]MBT2581419.1 catalase family peroxidase [Planococcus sp. ISL-109]
MEANKKAQRAIDQIEQVFGEHKGYRRAHARGAGYKGTFQGSGQAARLTDAAHFQQGTVPVFVRFSHFSPDPTWTDAMSPVKGMAVQFTLGPEQVTNIVSVTSPVFFTRSPERFLEMLEVSRSFQKGRPKLGELAELLTDFPEVRAMFASVRKMTVPESFATGVYHSIHAFYFEKGSARRAVKYVFEPDAGDGKLSLKDMKDVPFGYYEHELAERIADGPVHFNLYAILGEPDDPTDDPTREWPKERERVYLGRLQIEAEDDKAQQALYDPTVMTAGIACSDDPILQFRRSAYRYSHEKRTTENKKDSPLA